MEISNIMTKNVLTLKPTDSLNATIQKFAKKGVSGAPVINGHRHVIGIITAAELTRALDTMTPDIKVTSSKLFSLMFASLRSKKEEEQIKEQLNEAKKIKVDAFMSKPVVINQDASLTEAIKEMVNSNVDRLPVVNNKHKLVGILARADIIRALSNGF